LIWPKYFSIHSLVTTFQNHPLPLIRHYWGYRIFCWMPWNPQSGSVKMFHGANSRPSIRMVCEHVFTIYYFAIRTIIIARTFSSLWPVLGVHPIWLITGCISLSDSIQSANSRLLEGKTS
jgi:hypothetical protein